MAQGLVREPFAVVMGGVVAVVAIGEPAFDLFQRHQPVEGPPFGSAFLPAQQRVRSVA